MAGSQNETTRHAGGRPTRLSTLIQRKVIQALDAGNYREVAFSYAGISPRTGFRWMERGRAEEAEGMDTRFTQFRQAVEEAEAKAEMVATGFIRQAMRGDWKAASWYLERKHRQRWGRTTQEEAGGGSPDEYAQAIRAFLLEADLSIPQEPVEPVEAA